MWQLTAPISDIDRGFRLRLNMSGQPFFRTVSCLGFQLFYLPLKQHICLPLLNRSNQDLNFAKFTSLSLRAALKKDCFMYYNTPDGSEKTKNLGLTSNIKHRHELCFSELIKITQDIFPTTFLPQRQQFPTFPSVFNKAPHIFKLNYISFSNVLRCFFVKDLIVLKHKNLLPTER